MLVSQKHAVSLVCFDFFSEYQDSNSANRVSHFVLTGKKELKKGDSAADPARHTDIWTRKISVPRDFGIPEAFASSQAWMSWLQMPVIV